MSALDLLFQQLINGLIKGSLYAMIALGYTMVYGILGIINFAHGEVFMIGAMVAMTMTTYLLTVGVSPVLALVCAILVAMMASKCFGVATTDAPAVKRGRRLERVDRPGSSCENRQGLRPPVRAAKNWRRKR